MRLTWVDPFSGIRLFSIHVSCYPFPYILNTSSSDIEWLEICETVSRGNKTWSSARNAYFESALAPAPTPAACRRRSGWEWRKFCWNFGVVLRVIELSRLGFGRNLFAKDPSTLANVSNVDLEAGLQGLTLFKPAGHEWERWKVLGYG
jgi:hypothetical protein